MLKIKIFKILITIFVVSILSFSNMFAALDSLPDCRGLFNDCNPDPNYPVTTHSITECTYDVLANTNCCVDVTYTLTRYPACLPSLLPFYIFDILEIKVMGACYQTHNEVMDVAIKAVIAASNSHNIYSGSVNVPACIQASDCNSTDLTSKWINCNRNDPNCCRFDFEAGWDSIAYDMRLVNSKKHNYDKFCCTIGITCITCQDNCSDTLFPENGLFDMFEKLPEPCTTA